MVDRVGIGFIGCGNISAAYLKAARGFPMLDVRGVADLNKAAAEARAAEFGLKAMSVEELLADPSVEIVVNLTIPKAHVEVGVRAVAAGKHVHSEKPLGIATAEAKQLVEAAKAKGVRLGAAPDTFFGGAQQTSRKLVDEGAIGTPLGGTAFFMCPGHERWHPNPAFYYLDGGGPMLDMGPYYVTSLVNLLGPVESVAGVATKLRDERLVTSEPLKGTKIPVEVATHVAGTMKFVSGAVVSIAMSFDVPRHKHSPIELYGSDASLLVPDPNLSPRVLDGPSVRGAGYYVNTETLAGGGLAVGNAKVQANWTMAAGDVASVTIYLNGDGALDDDIRQASYVRTVTVTEDMLKAEGTAVFVTFERLLVAGYNAGMNAPGSFYAEYALSRPPAGLPRYSNWTGRALDTSAPGEL